MIFYNISGATASQGGDIPLKPKCPVETGHALFLRGKSHNTIKDPHRYAVQGSDTTMFSKEPSARTIKE